MNPTDWASGKLQFAFVPYDGSKELNLISVFSLNVFFFFFPPRQSILDTENSANMYQMKNFKIKLHTRKYILYKDTFF